MFHSAVLIWLFRKKLLCKSPYLNLLIAKTITAHPVTVSWCVPLSAHVGLKVKMFQLESFYGVF